MGSDEEQDWLSKLRLRVQLLPDNPYFQEQLHETRRQLGIPDGGFAEGDGLGVWLHEHLKAQDPRDLPYEDTSAQYTTPQMEEMHAVMLENLKTDAERSFKLGLRVPTQDRLSSLPVVEKAAELLKAFHLPSSVMQPLVWLILTGEAVPDTALSTMSVEDMGPIQDLTDALAAGGDEAMDLAVYESYVSGLPEGIRGNLVVVKMIVNEYTTKTELQEAWPFIQETQQAYGRRPNRRTTVAAYRDWLPAYLAHRVGGKSLFDVSDQFRLPVKTLQYRNEQLDEIFVRPENSTS